ncbi:hypothetical protein DL767_009495 [Monosporascus sp. MG133]|nr:hypothetical protein DL767_009495 [Monosporascus sp. MG133]
MHGPAPGPGTQCDAPPQILRRPLTYSPHSLWSPPEALNDIAFEKGNGNSAFGLPGYAASVDCIWSHIANVTGTKAWKQDIPACFGLVESTSFKVDDEELYVYGITYSPFTSEEGVSSEIVLGPPDEEGCYAANYDGLDEAGAATVIIYHDLTTTPTAGSMSEVNLDAYAHRASSTAPIVVEERITQKVFVETEEATLIQLPCLAPILTPFRLDPVKRRRVILELFKVLQNYRFKNKVRFAWWGAEENGVLGFRYYCANLEPTEIDNFLTYLDFGMVSKGYWGVSDNDGRAHGSIAPAGAEVILNFYHEFYESLGLEVTPVVLTNGTMWVGTANRHYQPATASSSASAPSSDPSSALPALGTSTAGLQERFWNQAYDELESSESEVVEVYEKLLSAELQDGGSSPRRARRCSTAL